MESIATSSSLLPKYFQITRDIIAMIQKGELSPGSVVPSENDIIEKYQVSNTTARKALHELEKGGRVTRVKGRGTFVRQEEQERNVSRLFSFTKSMTEVGRRPCTRLIGVHLREQDRIQIIGNREYTLKGPFCEIERLGYADDVPMMREIRYVSLQLFPDIQQKDLEKSLTDIFEQDYGVQLTLTNQTMSAIVLQSEWLNVFGLTEPTTAFRVEGVSLCGKDVVAEMEESIYRGDLYRFSVQAK